jgi:alpha-mannosidase
MRISFVRSTYCFVDHGGAVAHVVRIGVGDAPAGVEARATLAGPGIASAGTWEGRLDADLAGQPGGPAWAPARDPGLMTRSRFTPHTDVPDGPVVEVPVVFAAGTGAGDKVWARATVEAAGSVAQAQAELTVHEPGWRMVMVAHFHYDPVWWNTQAGYTSGWDELLWALERRETFQHSGLALVEAHLQRARLDPRYKFVLAEVDYLKPFWDLYPDRREEMRALISDGRLEIVGGTYNEPNTNLTGVETAIRAAVYGLGFQRDVMGADPKSAWQLDVFGHDPGFPGIMAASGVTSSAWARGPFHQWGPKREVGTNTWMQFPSEFEWISPNGLGLLTSYMPDHYSAGWELERATSVEGAMWQAYEVFCDLAEVSATKVTLLPVGTDYSPPSRFAADLADEWNRRYRWPRFELGLPKDFFGAVREEMGRTGRGPSPQSRDMNPVYTGKDVSFIDTKQAQRTAEVCLAEAESMAAISALLGGPVPWRALDKAWRQLEFNAHHDGITGSESDQVYLDILGGWREAYELARAAGAAARAELAAALDTRGDGRPVVVTNTLGFDRSEVVTAQLPAGEAFEVVDASGQVLPSLGQPGQSGGSQAVTFPASLVPGVGYKTFWLRRRPSASSRWSEAPGVTISNELVEAEAGRGGGLSRVSERESGFELVPPGEVAGELLVYPEYPAHPRFGEGPWNLLPSGAPARSGAGAPRVRKETCAIGERLVVEGEMPGEGFWYRQLWTLWAGSRRLEWRTEVHGWSGRDRLIRLRFPTVLAGATPVSAVGGSVIARGFGLIDVDVAEAPWTLDNPAAEWFGLSTTLMVEALEAAGSPAYHERSVGVAEVVTAAGEGSAPWARDLVLALVQKGVTATCSEGGANRYGALGGDSNLPDFRIAVGTPGTNPFVEQVLGAAGEAYRAELDAQLARRGAALLLVPPKRPLHEVWVPNADLRAPLALPVLVVAPAEPAGTAAAVSSLAAQVARGRVRVLQPRSLVPTPERAPVWTAAVLNRGTPGFAVDITGAMYVSVLRACTGWPSGVWIDPPRRTAPDGSAFELEHWSHVFEHAIVFARGDWREAGICEEAQAYNRPLVASLEEAHQGRLPAMGRLVGVKPVPRADEPALQAQSARAATGALAAAQAATGAPPVPRADELAPRPGLRQGRALLSVLKPAGNPYASGDPPEVAGGDGTSAGWPEVTLRCYEASGYPVEVEVTSAFPIVSARRADLVEVPGEEVELVSPGPGTGPGSEAVASSGSTANRAIRLALGPCELSTLRLQFGGDFSEGSGAGAKSSGEAAGAAGAAGAAPAGAAGAAGGAGGHALACEVEAAQPVFSRYWLHNRGAAPLGNQSLAVHVLAPSVVVRAGGKARLVAQVASGASRSVQASRLELAGPEGWPPDPPSWLFSLAPGAFVRVPVDFSVPLSARPGRYFLSARIADAAGQVQEDVATVDVLPALAEDATTNGTGGPLALPEPFGHPGGQWAQEIEPGLEVEEVTVTAGEAGRLCLRLVNRTAGEVRGEAQLLSPVETWPLVCPWDQGFVLGPGEARTLEAAVAAPERGWLGSWALWKVTYFGRIWYSPAVALRLGSPAGSGAAALAGRAGELAGARHG